MSDEIKRLSEMYLIEEEYYNNGITLVAGCDEAGRGPLAGPVVAAAVILPPHCEIPFLNDSKKLTEKKTFRAGTHHQRKSRGMVGGTDRTR